MFLASKHPDFLPWLPFIEKMKRPDIFVLSDDTQYVKETWANRQRIRDNSDKGWRWLTVPVRFSHPASYPEVWLAKHFVPDGIEYHLNVLRQNYGKHPYYGEIMSELMDRVYGPASSMSRLIDLNMATILYLRDKYGIDTEIVLASDILSERPRDKDDRLLTLCKTLGATEYLVGAGARAAYFDSDLLVRNGIQVCYQEFEHVPYLQHGQTEFVSGMSAIDALMNLGPDAVRLIEK